LTAGPLTQARVTKIFNQVQVVDPQAGSHAASIDELIKDNIGLKTGVKSRSELVFEDKTLTRIGPETYFTFKAGTRDISLQQGTMLLQVPKGLGGAKIRTAAITASITGTTIMVEHTPGKSLKVLVLEGSLRLSVNGTFGDSLVLTPGRMVIMRPDAKRIPDPVAVDLARVVRTSSLVKMDKKQGAPLPSMNLINKEIAVQQHEKGRANLIPTNLVIEGRGTNVTFASDEVLRTIAQRTNGTDDPLLLVSNSNGDGHHGGPSPTPAPSATPGQGSTPPPTSSPTPGVSPTATPGVSPTPGITPTPSPAPTPSGSPIVLSSNHDLIIIFPLTASSIRLTAGDDIKVFAPITAGNLIFVAGDKADFRSTITAASVRGTVEEDLYFLRPIDADSIFLTVGHHLSSGGQLVAPADSGSLLTGPSAGRQLTLNLESLRVGVGDGDDEHAVAGISLSGGDALDLSAFEGGSGGTLNVGSASVPTPKEIDISAPITATTGANGQGVLFGGAGGTVNLVSKDTVSVKSTIKVSDSAAGRASKTGGNISIDSRKTSGTAISVTSSGQLLSLLSNAAPGAGGTIKFTSAGGAVNVNGGKVQADRGTVDIRNNGSSGVVNLTNATLHGDVVKVGALGNNGTLNVGGGTISADSTIKLFAGGSNGTVNFTNNVTLSGASVKTIAGDTVKIFNGKIVTVNGTGPASVFTNNANYSGFGGNGSTTGTFAGQGATTQPLSALPPGY
jgi:hypothetical protein